MVKRNVNFNPGPAAVPLEVLKIVQGELLDYHDSGISILESSHRDKEFETVNDQAIALIHEIFGIGTDYQVIFMGGGASTQFDLVPMNFIGTPRAAFNDMAAPPLASPSILVSAAPVSPTRR